MPYTIKKIKNGYKVCKKRGSKCFSKKPFRTKKEAIAQMAAIRINESSKINLAELLRELIK